MKVNTEEQTLVPYANIPVGSSFLYKDMVYIKSCMSLVGGELSVCLNNGDTAVFSPTFKLKCVKAEVNVIK